MTIHINRPSSTRFIAAVRKDGCRNYQNVTKPLKRSDKAIIAMSKVFAEGNYKRGIVFMIADYYDPVLIAEIIRK